MWTICIKSYTFSTADSLPTICIFLLSLIGFVDFPPEVSGRDTSIKMLLTSYDEVSKNTYYDQNSKNTPDIYEKITTFFC